MTSRNITTGLGTASVMKSSSKPPPSCGDAVATMISWHELAGMSSQWSSGKRRVRASPRDPNVHNSSRPPQTPLQIFERFKRLMSDAEFSGLGSTGRGTLGISAGLAVFPYDASDAPGLIKAADEFLMFGTKQGGKNSIYLVGGEEPLPPHAT